MKKVLFFLASLTIALALTWGWFIPDAKKTYIGQWKGPGISLYIGRLGYIRYVRVDPADYDPTKSMDMSRILIRAPIHSFVGDDITVGTFFFYHTFHVTSPPHKEGSIWHMTVDGRELTRA
jgi:hypothetical protein